jgi:hypothetical protein
LLGVPHYLLHMHAYGWYYCGHVIEVWPWSHQFPCCCDRCDSVKMAVLLAVYTHCSSWILSWVAQAVWDLALSWWSSTPLASHPASFFKLHPAASTELHSIMQNSHFHQLLKMG